NIGLETGSEIHSKQIGKCGTPEDVVRSVRLARKYGMTPFVYFIYGLPGETEQTVEESKRIMRLVAEAGAERIILYGFRPLPDSAFAEHPSPSPTDPLSEPLRIEAARINREKKVDYVGQHIRGIAAEPSWERHGYTILYPLGEGPLMTVKGGWTAGTLLDIEVVEVLSPGLLLGEVIRSEE
ncbi:MAG: radical SAM protein, partial [Candidatus Thorarchaeota archaeon]